MSVWNPVWPNGAVSVRANTIPGQQNTNYINSVENVNHYWNVGANFDGNHRFIQMPNQAMDVALTASMDGGIYLKPVSVDNAQIQAFYRNAGTIYQFTPCFKSNSIALTSSYVNVVAVEANSYGQIWMFKNDNSDNVAMGFFQAGSTTCQAYACTTQFSSSSTADTNIKFGNGGSASGLNIRARTQAASSGTYQYRVIYWGV